MKTKLWTGWDSVRRLVRHLLILWHRKEITEALEVSWYAMEKYSPEECRREINASKKVLRKIGSLPNEAITHPHPEKTNL